MDYVRQVLEAEVGELSVLENDVLRGLNEHDLLSSNLNRPFEVKLSFGERLADFTAAFGGSWKFIILFGMFLVGWVIANTALFLARPPDPNPFILLNLVPGRPPVAHYHDESESH